MNCELVLSPAGRLHFDAGDGAGADGSDRWLNRVSAEFHLSGAAGLFALAASRPEKPLSASLSFWRGFASRYLTELCRTPESAAVQIDEIAAPEESDLASMLLSAPPMGGGEYLSLDVLRVLWRELDRWTRAGIAASGSGFSEWLKKHASVWHQVGRVCFHLAENRGDSEFPFAFLATYSQGLSDAGRVQYRPLGRALQEYSGERNRKALINLLSPVNRARERVDFVRELLDSGELFEPLAWTSAEAYRLLSDVAALEECGILVRLPDWWRKRPRPRVSVTIGEQRPGNLGVDSMLNFKVGVALGEETLTEEEWQALMASGDGLVQIRGVWVEVDAQRLSRLLDHWKQVEKEAGERGISFVEGMRLLAGAPAKLAAHGTSESEDRQWAFVDAGSWLSEVLEGLRNPERLKSGPPDVGFRGELRPYQVVGRNWLRLLSDLGLGACLADDMGLGKTVQVVSLLLALKQDEASGKPSILVLPASLIANWKAEIERFAPTLRTSFIHPSETDPATLALIAGNADENLAGIDLVLTSYGMLLRQKWLLEVPWRLAILDEAQAIKNPATRQTRAVKQIRSDARIALTGTPVENRLSDLWSLFDFLCPGLLGSAARFKQFVKSMEGRPQEGYAPLRNLVRPYILRRLKTDRSIITDLPDKTEVKAFCGLTGKQAALYSRSVEELAATLSTVEGMGRLGLVLSYLMRFKQICNHPSQWSGDGVYDPSESGKFARLGDICEEIASRQEKLLVFTQFREMTGPIAAFLAPVFGREGLILHGGTKVKERQLLVDAFQAEDGPPYFVLSLKAGGTGLNLTAASHVVHFDRWWNPAVENQATDRAFRIGQHRNVVVHKFVCRGTIEEKIDALIEEKTNLADDILAGGAESLLTEMSDEDLLKAVALDVDRVDV